MIYIYFLISQLICQIPIDFSISKSNIINRYDDISEIGIYNNSIIDIKPLNSTNIFFSTGSDYHNDKTKSALSYATLSTIHPDSILFRSFNKNYVSLPRGGAPALAVRDNIIAISGILDTIAVTGEEIMGTGISYSIDEGETWFYLPQPIDKIPDTGKYHNINWGNQSISALAITTEINNISYDLSIEGEYIYAASWAGGIRRYGPIYSDLKSWEIIPLPMDSDSSLICNEINLNNYEVNPNDPINGGNHNHKGFSIYVINDTIWAGTANGINKGVIDNNSTCINWTNHYTSTWDDISGNWVIGFHNQTLGDNIERIWAITWAGEGNNENNALSYSENGGKNWQITSPSGYSEKVYNLYSNENKIWAATKSGLYLSKDGRNWEKYLRPIDSITGQEILTNEVLSVYYNGMIWAGTPVGLSIISNDTLNTIYKFQAPASPFYAYPNPFLINNHNQIDNNGYAIFIFSNPNNYFSSIDIFDFSMDKVIQLNNAIMINDIESQILWNGKNDYGHQVNNGVYFCRLSINGTKHWTKLAVIN